MNIRHKFFIHPDSLIFQLPNLKSQLFLNSDRVEGASFHCPIIGNNHGVHPMYLANLCWRQNKLCTKSNVNIIPLQQHRHMAHLHIQDRGLKNTKDERWSSHEFNLPAVIPNSHISVSGSINALIRSLTKTFKGSVSFQRKRFCTFLLSFTCLAIPFSPPPCLKRL